MNAGQAASAAREWVANEGSRTPGFCAAHLMGSILTLPPEAPFPSTGDVDFNIVVDLDQATETYNIPYKGLILEYSVVSRRQYATPEAVLADPGLAPNLAMDSVLADSDGTFGALQRAVARHYGEKRWVLARCAAQKNQADEFLRTLDGTDDPGQVAFTVNGVAMYLSGLLAVADGLGPTHRRCLVLMKERLAAHGRPELYEDTLDLLGFREFTPSQAEGYLRACAAAFDRAVEVRKSPCWFPSKFQAHVRPYVIDGPRAMIAEGHFREAMLWIEGWLVFSNAVIQADAPAAERPIFAERLAALRAAKGAGAADYVVTRRAKAQALASAVYDLSDEITSRIAL